MKTIVTQTPEYVNVYPKLLIEVALNVLNTIGNLTVALVVYHVTVIAVELLPITLDVMRRRANVPVYHNAVVDAATNVDLVFGVIRLQLVVDRVIVVCRDQSQLTVINKQVIVFV
jgi:hypothetical protein